MRRFGPVLLFVALAGGLACSRDADRRSGGEATASPPVPPSLQPPRAVFGEANWDLDAEPAGLPAAQRVDPTTGRPVPLPSAQRASLDDAPLSPLEQERLAGGGARGVSTDDEEAVR